MSEQSYSAPRAVEAAIKQAAVIANSSDPSLTVNERIRMTHFDRLLSRIFSEGEASRWVLKGGIAMLARVPSARATKGIDLYRSGIDLNEALADLKRLAEVDLGDFFRYVFRGYRPVLADATQPYVDGYRVTFDVYLGLKQLDPVGIDLTVTSVVRQAIEVNPAHRLALPRLPAYPVRICPVAAQIADKVCATLTIYNGKPSSREKDLVDLVILATTQDLLANELRNEITREAARRRIELPSSFDLPPEWGIVYQKLAQASSACHGYESVDQTRELMHRLINPIMDKNPDIERWDAASLRWE